MLRSNNTAADLTIDEGEDDAVFTVN